MTDTYVGQPATAEATPTVAAPQHAACLAEIARLEAEIRNKDGEILDLHARLNVAHNRIASARGGVALTSPQPFAQPWPMSAEAVIVQLRTNLAEQETRLRAAEIALEDERRARSAGRVVRFGIGSRL